VVRITLEFESIDAAGAALACIKAAGEIPGMTVGTHTLVKAIGAVPEQRTEQKAQTAIQKAAKAATAKPIASEKETRSNSLAKDATLPTAAVTPEAEYSQVSKRITEVGKTDRDRVIAALTKFGVKRGPELKAEQYADFLAALNG